MKQTGKDMKFIVFYTVFWLAREHGRDRSGRDRIFRLRILELAGPLVARRYLYLHAQPSVPPFLRSCFLGLTQSLVYAQNWSVSHSLCQMIPRTSDLYVKVQLAAATSILSPLSFIGDKNLTVK